MVCQRSAQEKLSDVLAGIGHRENQRGLRGQCGLRGKSEHRRGHGETGVEPLLPITIERHACFVIQKPARGIERRSADLHGDIAEQIRRRPQAESESATNGRGHQRAEIHRMSPLVQSPACLVEHFAAGELSSTRRSTSRMRGRI